MTTDTHLLGLFAVGVPDAGVFSSSVVIPIQATLRVDSRRRPLVVGQMPVGDKWETVLDIGWRNYNRTVRCTFSSPVDYVSDYQFSNLVPNEYVKVLRDPHATEIQTMNALVGSAVDFEVSPIDPSQHDTIFRLSARADRASLVIWEPSLADIQRIQEDEVRRRPRLAEPYFLTIQVQIGGAPPILIVPHQDGQAAPPGPLGSLWIIATTKEQWSDSKNLDFRTRVCQWLDARGFEWWPAVGQTSDKRFQDILAVADASPADAANLARTFGTFKVFRWSADGWDVVDNDGAVHRISGCHLRAVSAEPN